MTPQRTPCNELTPSSNVASARLHRFRAARSGISNFVDALKVSKPPRAPTKRDSQTPNASRRHALIPLAEGRQELEARIRALEDTLAARDDSLVRLKRQMGRTLIKRRHAEKERDITAARLSHASVQARAHHQAAVSAKFDLQTTVDHISTSLHSAHQLLSDASTVSTFSDLRLVLDNISAALDVAKAKLAVDLPPYSAPDDNIPPPSTKSRASSLAHSDDDARSCASYASSMLGDDREAQLESLVELVDILNIKLSTGGPNQNASNAVKKAQRTILAVQKDHEESLSGEVNGERETDLSEKRCDIARIVDEVLKERLQKNRTKIENNVTGASSTDHRGATHDVGIINCDENDVAELAQTALARAELHEARQAADSLRKRVQSLEKLAERALRVDEITEQNAVLAKELAVARSTVTRMIRDRGPIRRTGASSAPFTPGSTPRGVKALQSNGVVPDQDVDVLRRVLDWQQEASNADKHIVGDNEVGKGNYKEEPLDDCHGREPVHANSGIENSVDDSCERRRKEGSSCEEQQSQEGQQDGVKTSVNENTSVNTRTNIGEFGGLVEDAVLSERISDGGANDDAASTQSLPMRGILRRQDSFFSATCITTSSNEYPLVRSRNILLSSTPPADGLRGLLDR